MFSEQHEGLDGTKRADSRGVDMRLTDRISLHTNACAIMQALHAATEKALHLANMELQQVSFVLPFLMIAPFPESVWIMQQQVAYTAAEAQHAECVCGADHHLFSHPIVLVQTRASARAREPRAARSTCRTREAAYWRGDRYICRILVCLIAFLCR